jgi:hypothetical protein
MNVELRKGWNDPDFPRAVALCLIQQFPLKPLRVKIEAQWIAPGSDHLPFSSFPEFHIPQSSSTF